MTNDAGVGMLQALGYRFKDEEGNEVGPGGNALSNIHRIDSAHIHPEVRRCEFKIACDVNNPLYGPNGAAYVFAPQKGANSAMVEELDRGLNLFAGVAQRELGIDLQDIPGAGAASGLGAAFAAFLKAEMRSGLELVLDKIGLKESLASADFVITGEGKLDGQTSMGKAPLGVAALAHAQGIPVIALAGGITKEASALNDLGITSFHSIISAPMSLEQAMDPVETRYHLRSTTKQLFRLIHAVKAAENQRK